MIRYAEMWCYSFCQQCRHHVLGSLCNHFRNKHDATDQACVWFEESSRAGKERRALRAAAASMVDSARTNTVFEFDKSTTCCVCGLPVMLLSTGGYEVCPWCNICMYRNGQRWSRSDTRDIALLRQKAAEAMRAAKGEST
jgi:hypothetical protein